MPRWEPVRELNIFDPISDSDYWGNGDYFRDPDTYFSWFVALKAIFALPMTLSELHVFRKCTGRHQPSPTPYKSGFFVCGRKSGKSRCLSLIACYLAVFKRWDEFLSPGEVPTIKVISVDRRQSRVIYNFCKAFLSVPSLAHLIEKDTGDEIILTNGVISKSRPRVTEVFAVTPAWQCFVTNWPFGTLAKIVPIPIKPSWKLSDLR